MSETRARGVCGAFAVAFVIGLVLFVFGRERDVDRRENTENEHLHDANERAENEDGDREQERDHPEGFDAGASHG